MTVWTPVSTIYEKFSASRELYIYYLLQCLNTFSHMWNSSTLLKHLSTHVNNFLHQERFLHRRTFSSNKELFYACKPVYLVPTVARVRCCLWLAKRIAAIKIVKLVRFEGKARNITGQAYIETMYKKTYFINVNGFPTNVKGLYGKKKKAHLKSVNRVDFKVLRLKSRRAMKVLLVYNPNYSSCFPLSWYWENLVFDLIHKWDAETYQMEIMTVIWKCSRDLITRRRNNVTSRRSGDVLQRYMVFHLKLTGDNVEKY